MRQQSMGTAVSQISSVSGCSLSMYSIGLTFGKTLSKEMEGVRRGTAHLPGQGEVLLTSQVRGRYCSPPRSGVGTAHLPGQGEVLLTS